MCRSSFRVCIGPPGLQLSRNTTLPLYLSQYSNEFRRIRHCLYHCYDEEDSIEGLAGCVRSQQSDKVDVVVRSDRYGDRV